MIIFGHDLWCDVYHFYPTCLVSFPLPRLLDRPLDKNLTVTSQIIRGKVPCIYKQDEDAQVHVYVCSQILLDVVL